jgi:Tfp pilus assembly protein PilN
MIKINLLPQRKPKRVETPGQRDVGIGVLALIGAGAAVYFLLHKPAAEKLDDLKANNEQLASQLAKRKDSIRDLKELQAAVALAEGRTKAIDRLVAARAVPAHMLHELGLILTMGEKPTMTEEMTAKVNDPNKDTYKFQFDWDPKHVWITKFSEKQGVFTLEGGAESDTDVSQLTKRMQASAYFMEVTPRGGEQTVDDDSGQTYYKFTITGKVVY